MANDASSPTAIRAAGAFDAMRRIAPGLALSAAVAVVAALIEPITAKLALALTGRAVAVPAVVVALVVGMALHGLAARPLFEPGMTFSVKRLLRVAIALLGLRVALGDIVALGWSTGLIVVASMALTIACGLALARGFGREPAYGALAGGATAVCGASAALATATVLPNYRGRDAEIVFTVVAVNALSTLAMVAYPALGPLFGFEDRQLGVLLGATIHDVAQVVGAGYAVSETVGNTAVVVKLFRVFLLLPVVIGIGWWFAGRGGVRRARVPVPVFALVFLALVVVNSTGLVQGAIKTGVGEISRWGLLIAIGALGLGTSVTAILSVGWRHVAIVCGTTLVILAAVLGGLLLSR